MKTWEITYRSGLNVWAETYRLHPDDDNFAVMRAAQWAAEHGFAVPLTNDERSVFLHTDNRTIPLAGSARWVDGGCRAIVTDEKYFAAMANTAINEDAVLDLRVPWPSFRVSWPKGLCVAEDGHDYTEAYFTQFSDVMWLPPGESVPRKVPVVAVAICTGEVDGSEMSLLTCDYDTSLPELLFAGHKLKSQVIDDRDEVQSPGDRAIRRMVFQATAGLLYTMQHTRNWKVSAFSEIHGVGSTRGAPPPHRTIVVGRPIALDATSAVRERACGRSSAGPAVQTLVIGHVKRQVCGPGRSGRKVIWVEPYWRGPEDAPILARPYRVGAGL